MFREINKICKIRIDSGMQTGSTNFLKDNMAIHTH